VGVAWVTWPNFEILGPPYNFWTNGDICFKFGKDIECGPQLRPDHKSTPKWEWPGSHDQISKFWDPPITFERIEISTSNLARKTDPYCIRIIKWPLSGHGLGHVTKFRNSGTSLITLERIEISASNLALTQTTEPYYIRTIKWPLSGRGLGHVTEFCTQWTNCFLPADITWKVNDMFINKNKTANIKGKN